MKTLIAILNFLGIRTPRQRAIKVHRSEGAKKGWVKRKDEQRLHARMAAHESVHAAAKPEVPNDIQ